MGAEHPLSLRLHFLYMPRPELIAESFIVLRKFYIKFPSYFIEIGLRNLIK